VVKHFASGLLAIALPAVDDLANIFCAPSDANLGIFRSRKSQSTKPSIAPRGPKLFADVRPQG
jgi:hypothetical protein